MRHLIPICSGVLLDDPSSDYYSVLWIANDIYSLLRLHSSLTFTFFPSISTVRTLKSTPMVFCCFSEKVPDLKFWTTQVLPTLESPIRMILKRKSKESSCSGPGVFMVDRRGGFWRKCSPLHSRSPGMLQILGLLFSEAESRSRKMILKVIGNTPASSSTGNHQVTSAGMARGTSLKWWKRFQVSNNIKSVQKH